MPPGAGFWTEFCILVEKVFWNTTCWEKYKKISPIFNDIQGKTIQKVKLASLKRTQKSVFWILSKNDIEILSFEYANL